MVKTNRYWIELCSEQLHLDKYLPFLTDPTCGAQLLFIGTVRNFAEGKSVQGLVYECYESMAEKELEDILKETFQQWDVKKIVVAHRTGSLSLTEPSVYILVAAPHRADAYAASRYIIEEIKVRVPIWKKEIFEDNSSLWKFDKLSEEENS